MAGFALIFTCGLVMSIVHGIRSAHLLFARERAGGTMDDLALARGRILFVVHAKIKDSLLRSQRALCIQLCQEYQDPDFWAELNRMFPNPDRSRRTPALR